MKFLLSRIPRCGNQSYDIEIYNGERTPLNGELIDTSKFREGYYTSPDTPLESVIENVKERMEEIGEDPDSDESREIYDMLYDPIIQNKKRRYISEYASMIRNMADTIGRIVRGYFEYKHQNKKIPENATSGFFEYTTDKSDKEIQGFIIKSFDLPPTPLTAGNELYLIKINNGYGCMTSCWPIGIFFNRTEAELFEKKVKDAIKDFESDPAYDNWCNCDLVKYLLRDDLKTFR